MKALQVLAIRFGFALGCLLVSACLFNPKSSSAQGLVINEILASNQKVNVDEDQEASDWLELYNPGAEEIDLSGYSLTDKVNQPAQWTFPAIKIGPRAHMLVWASEKNRKNPGALHTNFRLGAGGEFLGLFAPNGQVVDSLYFPAQQNDISYGRFPDGQRGFHFMRIPTPEGANQYLPPGEDVAVQFSLHDGVYANSVSVALATNAPGTEIRYTLTGDEPGKESARYEGPLTLTTSAIVRACVFAGDSAVSAIGTRTYIVNDDPKLPVLSLVTAPANLWDPATGIYVNHQYEGREWERVAHLALLEEGAVKFSHPVGVRIHGGSSRESPKKNFRVFFRGEYGQSALNYRVFPQKLLDHFETLVLYAPSGDQPTGGPKFTLIDDALTHSLWLEIGGLASAFRPVSLYLNGEYWGVYWIREHVNADYVVNNLGITEMDLLRTSGDFGSAHFPEVRAGDTEFWLETYDYFASSNFNHEATYELARSRYVNIENFVDYNLLNIFGGNWDWPHNNHDRFRNRAGDDPRWRWIMWDTGAAWNHVPQDHLTLEWATRDRVRTDIHARDSEGKTWSTLLLRQLLSNEEFRHYFINRFADLINTLLSVENIHAHIAALSEWIRPEMTREMKRWDWHDYPQWDRNLQNVRNFVSQREWIQREHIINKFGLRGSAKVTLLPSSGNGGMAINTISPHRLPWTGTYFIGVPITIRATPAPGYAFEKWSDSSLPNNPVVTISLEQDLALSAIFAAQAPVLNNIQIDSLGQHEAWLSWETDQATTAAIDYGTAPNYGETQLDSSWQTRHSFHLSNLRENTRYYFRLRNKNAAGLESRSADSTFTTLADRQPPLIIQSSITEITATTAMISWQTNEPANGQAEYGLTPALGQTSALDVEQKTSHHILLEHLWPDTLYHCRIRSRDAAGNLGLSMVQTFRTLRAPTGVFEQGAHGVPEKFLLSSNYPNPFGAATQLDVHVPGSGRLLAVVYNVNGQEITRIYDGAITAGYKVLRWDGSSAAGLSVPNGVYLLRLRWTAEEGKSETALLRLLVRK